MSGGLLPLWRRCAPALAGACAAVAALLPMSTGATPALTVVASIACPSGAICDGNADLTPGLHSTDAFVACSTEDLPTLAGKVLQTGIACTLQGTLDGIFYFSGSNWSSGFAPATLTNLITGIPLQAYRLCVVGSYQLNNGTIVSGGPVCGIGNAPPAS
jgi:hypothetical protein